MRPIAKNMKLKHDDCTRLADNYVLTKCSDVRISIY